MDYCEITMSTEMQDQIRETVITRVNQQFKSLDVPKDNPEKSNLVHSVLEHVLPLLVSSVVSSVTDVMTSFMARMEQAKADCESSNSPQVGALQAQVRCLHYQNDALEQYQRRESIRIFGVKEDPNENAEATEIKALGVIRETGASVVATDISACHRVGKPRDGSRAIIVKFVSRKKRQEVVTKKKNLKGKAAFSKVFVNDDLTVLRQRLLGYVKSLDCVESAWTSGGRILASKKTPPGLPQADRTRPIVIESPDDLFKLGVDSVDYSKMGLSHLGFATSK